MLEIVLVIDVLYVFVPSDRRKYSVTDCPILPENVTRKVADVVTVEQAAPGLKSDTHTFVAAVPSGFLMVPVKVMACGVAAVVGFGVAVGGFVVVTGGVVGRGVAGRCVAVGTGDGVGDGVGEGVALGDADSVGAGSTISGATGRFCWTMRSVSRSMSRTWLAASA